MRKSALQFDPEIPPRWMSSSRQVPVCVLPLSSNASAEANVRLSMPLCANSRATPFRKPALSSTAITTVGVAICVSSPIFVSSPRAVVPNGGGRPLIWIKEI